MSDNSMYDNLWSEPLKKILLDGLKSPVRMFADKRIYEKTLTDSSLWKGFWDGIPAEIQKYTVDHFIHALERAFNERSKARAYCLGSIYHSYGYLRRVAECFWKYAPECDFKHDYMIVLEDAIQIQTDIVLGQYKFSDW